MATERQTAPPDPRRAPRTPRARRASPAAPRADRRPDDRGSREGRDLREVRILDAAAALLVRWGYRKTTIDDVAREARVGKGTVYLHWKDKSELFRAVLWRASEQTTDDMMRRVAADPQGGLFHRVWAHGMLALFANPLMASLMGGRSDIFQGLMTTMPAATLGQLVSTGEAQIVELQQAGLIRADVPVSVIVFLIGAIKIGIIHLTDFVPLEQVPSEAQLADAISDLMRRWLEPEQASGDSEAGKRIMGEWLDRVNEIGARG